MGGENQDQVSVINNEVEEVQGVSRLPDQPLPYRPQSSKPREEQVYAGPKKMDLISLQA